MNVTSTDDAAAGVFAPITTTTVVAVAYKHEKAAVPIVGKLLPTLALHAKPDMKLVPVTVIVLPRYPAAGLTEVAVGAPVTVSTVVPVVNKTVAGFVMAT